MSLPVGTRLGPFETLAPIGKGGMGEVYRARDTRLKRDVALKILPPEFASDPERAARFQREAEVLASLNHPNIAQIYGVAEADGVRALVMELVDGQSPSGPTKFEDAWKIMAQVAEGLEYAHERRIVHRDLKPSNLKVTPEGRVKILDFGLAKALAGTPVRAEAAGADSPTLTMGATKAGVILGTAAYMAPEQVKGREADRRADIWAFGVVLYELLTGERPFRGKDTTEVLARVVTDEPVLDKAPARVRWLLSECLKKEPEERLRDIGDAARLLEEPSKAISSSAESRPLGWVAKWAPWAIAGLMAAVAVGVAFVHFRNAGPETRTITATIVPPEDTSFDFSGGYDPPALSPDGRQLVFGARAKDGTTQLWVRVLDSPTARALPGTDGAQLPFWSPDSQSIAFFRAGELERVSVAGGPALALASAGTLQLPFGGAWSSRDVIVFSPSFSGPLQKVAAAGGTPSPATRLGPKDYSHRSPWFLPDGRHFLFTSQPEAASTEVTLNVGSLDSADAVTIGTASAGAVYAEGYLLYLRQDTLMAQPFDASRLKVTGDAAPVAERISSVMTYTARTLGAFSVARGLLAYQSGAGGSQQLTWFNRDGKAVGTVGDPADFRSLDLSHDGAQAITTRLGQTPDLWLYEMERGLGTRFAFGPAAYRAAIWSADGKFVAYDSDPHGQYDLYRKAANGTGNEELLFADQALKIPASWSPDGRSLLFYRYDTKGKTQRDLWVLPIEGGPGGKPGTPYPFLVTPFNEAFAKFSADGHWVAYQSDESGRYEIYVTPFPGPGTKRQVSAGGGVQPRWRGDGKEIFYVGPSGTLTSTEVSERGDAIEPGAVHQLRVPVIALGFYLYDVSADGQRFLVAAPPEKAAPLTLVTNWTELLKK